MTNEYLKVIFFDLIFFTLIDQQKKTNNDSIQLQIPSILFVVFWVTSGPTPSLNKLLGELVVQQRKLYENEKNNSHQQKRYYIF